MTQPIRVLRISCFRQWSAWRHELRDGNEIAIILSNATQLPLSRRECRIRSSWEFAKLKLDLIKQTLDAARGSGSVSARALISNKQSCVEMLYAEWWTKKIFMQRLLFIRWHLCRVFDIHLIHRSLLIYLTERQYKLYFLRLTLLFEVYLLCLKEWLLRKTLNLKQKSCCIS